MKFIRIAIIAIVAMISSTIAHAGECPPGRDKYVVGLASEQALAVQEYCIGQSISTTFNDINNVPGFQGCQLTMVVVYWTLSCDGVEYQVNAHNVVNNCHYVGVHRADGLGFDRKATWDVWSRAARACGEVERSVFDKYAGYAAKWAAADLDLRYATKKP